VTDPLFYQRAWSMQAAAQLQSADFPAIPLHVETHTAGPEDCVEVWYAPAFAEYVIPALQSAVEAVPGVRVTINVDYRRNGQRTAGLPAKCCLFVFGDGCAEAVRKAVSDWNESKV
jgi:hypothetical protein